MNGLNIITTASTQLALEQAERHCSGHRSRLTRKRRQVLSGLLESDKALSAYELVDIFRNQQEYGLLPMSVYRILEFLEGEGLVHRLSTANKYVACSHITCCHEHEVPQFLICKQCYRVEEIAIPGELIEAIAQSAEKAGFRLAGKQLEIDCICRQCAAGYGTD